MLDPIDDIVATLQRYLDTPSVVGHETPFLRLLEQEFAALGCAVDRREHLLLIDGGDAAQAHLVCVHIDRHGLVSNGAGEFEYAAWETKVREYREDVKPSRAMAQRLRERFVGERGVAYHSTSGDQLACATIVDAYFCEQRQNVIFRVPGLESLPRRTPVMFARGCETSSEWIVGQLDNAISAAIVHRLYRAGFRGRTAFTAEEEIGRSWRHLLDGLERSGITGDSLVVLDTSPFPDSRVVDAGCVVLRTRDSLAAFEPVAVRSLAERCALLGIPFVFKDKWIEAENEERLRTDEPPLPIGRTELGRLIVNAPNAWTGTTLQAPSVGYHTNRESTSVRSVLNVLRVLGDLVGVDAVAPSE